MSGCPSGRTSSPTRSRSTSATMIWPISVRTTVKMPRCLHPLRLGQVVLGRREVVQRTRPVAMDQEELDEGHQPPPPDRWRRVLVADREDAPAAAILDAGEDDIGQRFARVVPDAKLEQVGSGRVGPQLDADPARPTPVARPRREPPLEQPGRDLGLDEMLVLRRGLAHRLRRGRPSGDGHQRRVEPVAADE